MHTIAVQTAAPLATDLIPRKCCGCESSFEVARVHVAAVGYEELDESHAIEEKARLSSACSRA